jgi:hypothetical protein
MKAGNEGSLTKSFYDRQRAGVGDRKGTGPKTWGEIDPDNHHNYTKEGRPTIFVGVEWAPTTVIPRRHFKKAQVLEVKDKSAILALCDTDSGEPTAKHFEIHTLKGLQWWTSKDSGGYR